MVFPAGRWGDPTSAGGTGMTSEQSMRVFLSTPMTAILAMAALKALFNLVWLSVKELSHVLKMV
jgi:hypothetical protein